MFEGLGGLTIVRNSGVLGDHHKQWIITLKSDHPMSFRIRANDDGYASQSFLKFEKLTDGGWVTICSRLGDELPLRAGRDSRGWAEEWAHEIDDITLEACRLLDILGDES